MTGHAFYNQALHGPYKTYRLGDFPLQDGTVLTDGQIAYATFGTLSPARDNAILVTTWFSGTSKIMEQVYVGPDHAIDPSRYFVVIVNQIGNGLSTSPHNAASSQSGPDFPPVHVADDVRAQHRLLTEQFGIESLALVTGASMGAQQTYEWAVRYPQMVQRAAPIAGTARTTALSALCAESLSDAITSDPTWNAGRYTDGAVREGLRRHARLWAVVGTCPALYAQELWRGLGFDTVASFVQGLLEASFQPLDANALLAQAWKWCRADVSLPYNGDLTAALGRIKAKTCVMAISTDAVFPVADCEAEQRRIPGSSFCELTTDWGHLGVMGMDPGFTRQVDGALRTLLA